jgi:hypothetical protein
MMANYEPLEMSDTIAQTKTSNTAAAETCKEELDDTDFETLFRKLLVFPPLIFTTIISLILVGTFRNHHKLGHPGVDWIVNNRATVGFFIQILSGFLGLAQIGTLRTIINYRTRQTLTTRSLTLDRINLFVSLSTSQINWALPIPSLFTVLGFAAITSIPAAIWAGALTPTVVEVMLNTTIPVVSYPNNSMQPFETDGWISSTRKWQQTRQGMFSYGPQLDRYSNFIADGSTASSVDGLPVLNRKADNSNYTYHGRSYGIAASVGVMDGELTGNTHLLRYSFNETGYRTTYTCVFNASSKSTLTATEYEGGSVYRFRSGYEHAGGGGYWAADLSGGDNILAAGAWFIDAEDEPMPGTYKYGVDIYGAGNYTVFNTTQCIGTFVPATFEVNVDATERSITVIPSSNANGKVDEIDPQHLIVKSAGDTLAALAIMSTTAYFSTLGQMFLNNLFNVHQQAINSSEIDSARTLRAVAESLQALADQNIFSSAGAQLVIGNVSQDTSAIAYVSGIQIGQAGFIYAAVAINAAIVLILVFEAAVTRLWRRSTKLNFADVKSMVVGSSIGGGGVAEKVKARIASKKVWRGEDSDRISGGVKVVIMRAQNGLGVYTEDGRGRHG